MTVYYFYTNLLIFPPLIVCFFGVYALSSMLNSCKNRLEIDYHPIIFLIK